MATTETKQQAAVGEDVDVDFQGEVETDDRIPSLETLRKVASYKVLDRDGKAHDFKSLWAGPDVARRVLVVFVRHFFCGSCQEFLRTVSESITPDALQPLSSSTSLVIIGCGDPALIDIYATETNCKFPIYTDPTAALFKDLDMVRTLAMGAKPGYFQKSTTRNIVGSFFHQLSYLPSGLALKSGDVKQVGGEFLFEPVDGDGEEKHVTWCHRMKTTRDHTEVPGLREVLGI